MDIGGEMGKLEQLKDYISSLIEDGVCVAFSGGVDSSLILKIACDEAKRKGCSVYAVTFDTRLHPTSDMKMAKEIAEEMGAIYKVIQIDEFSDPEIYYNPYDRCYRCKKLLFNSLRSFAEANSLNYIVDGTNYDDLSEYRPGIRALSELNIKSPLAELSIEKKEVRKMAGDLNIKSSNRPSAPCLATRLPYGAKLDWEVLKKIELGEEHLKSMGFEIIRLRLHGEVLRIETDKKFLMQILERRDEIIKYLKSLGFVYITMDMEGFRSGSMDLNLRKEI